VDKPKVAETLGVVPLHWFQSGIMCFFIILVRNIAESWSSLLHILGQLQKVASTSCKGGKVH